MRKTSSLMLLVALATSYFVIGNGYHMLDDIEGHNCLNDGFLIASNGENSCQCKDSNYIEGEFCEKWKCINFGKGIVRKEYDTSEHYFTSCDCPLGFRGLHCEAVACVPNSDGYIKAFNPVERSFTIIITYNDKFVSDNINGNPPDNITAAITDMLKNPPFDQNIDRLHVVIFGLGDPYIIDCKNAGPGSLSDCFNSEFEFYLFYESYPNYNFASSDLLTVIQDASAHSSVLLISNLGFTDVGSSNFTQQINLVAQTAVARQIELNVIIGQPNNNQGQNIFLNAKFKPIIETARKTLGTFIAAYGVSGGAHNMTMSRIIPPLAKIIATKTVVDFGTWNITGQLAPANSFNVLSVGNDVRKIYISVAANSPLSANMDVELTNGANFDNFTLELNAGVWKLFSYSYTQTTNGYLVLYNISEPCTYHIWTVSNSDDQTTTQPRTFIGFSNDPTSDASSPIAIYGSGFVQYQNMIVAHMYNADPKLKNSTVASISLAGGKASNVVGTARNCLFDLQYTSANCSTAKDYGTIQIKSTAESFYFQETLPIICGTIADTQVPSVADIFTSNRNSKKIKADNKISVSNDAFTCTPDSDNGVNLSPNETRSFVFAFPNYPSLNAMLFNGPLGSSTIFKTLKNYVDSYGAGGVGYFSNFILSPFTATSQNIKLDDSFAAFQQKLGDAYGNVSSPEPTSGTLDQGLTIFTLINYTQTKTYSEIFIVTNKVYGNSAISKSEIHKNLADKRIKLNFLLYDDGAFEGFGNRDLLMDFYDLASRSGGNVILLNNKTIVQQFFDNYQTKQISQNTISSFKNILYSGPGTVGEFYYSSGTEYYIAATINHSPGDPFDPYVRMQGERGNNNTYNVAATVFIGQYYALFAIPKNLTSGGYSVNVVTGGAVAPYFYVNVFERNPSVFYVIGFSNNPTSDIQVAYPSFSGSGSRVYVVANVKDKTQSDFTISYPDNTVYYDGVMEERSSCSYNLISSGYTWQCSEPNSVFYITLYTDSRTHTEMFPCFENGGSDTGTCQNGATPKNGVCICLPGFEGSNCGDPICFNGGTIGAGNICECPDLYDGDHCERAKFSCQKDIPFPRYTSIIDTFVLVIDLSILPATPLPKYNVPKNFQQYILVSAYVMFGNDQVKIEVFDNPSFFSDAISGLKQQLNSYPRDSKLAIKRALEAVKTERTLLVWLSGSTVLCGVDSNDPQPDDELLNLLAKRKVELRAFTTAGSKCHRMIASYGNGVPLLLSSIDDVFAYVNLLIPQTVSDNTVITKNLVVIDSYISDDCTSNLDIDIAMETEVLKEYDDLHIILYNFAPNNTDDLPSSSLPSNMFSITTSKFTVTPPPKTKFCGYIIEGRHISRVAYEVTPSNNFEAEGYAVFYASETTNLNVYFENGLNPENMKSYSDFPEVFTANVEYTNFTYEHAPVIQRNCTYPWSIEIMCQGFNGALKTKLIMKDSGNNLHQRLITTYCVKKMSCPAPSTKLLADDKADDDGISRKVWTCGCNPLWTGTDCSIPICLNGGTPNRESCNCLDTFTGSNCEKKLAAPLVYRVILIIYDVTGGVEQLASRKDLATQFLSMYATDTQTYYSFSTNIDDGNQVKFTNNATLIQNAINAAVFSNETIELTQAFDFFLRQSLITPFEQAQVNGMFYITDSSIDPEQDLSSLFELQSRGFYLYSVYYYANTDPSIPRLSDLSGLGGTTGAWNIHDILSDFTTFLQGGNLAIIPPPPPTTTARPIPCVYRNAIDIVIFFDAAVTSYDNFVFFFDLESMVAQLAVDLKFASPTDKDGSRAGFVVINKQLGILLCLTNEASLIDATKTTTPDYPSPNDIDLNNTLSVTDALLGPGAADYRKVPKFAIIITDRPNVKNPDAVLAQIQKLKNETNFIAITYGPGDFSAYDNLVDSGMHLTFTETTPSSINTLRQNLYQQICATVNDYPPGIGDTNYRCPTRKSNEEQHFVWN